MADENKTPPLTEVPKPSPEAAEQKITPMLALQNLAVASREARLNANEHDIIKKSVDVLLEFLREFSPTA